MKNGLFLGGKMDLYCKLEKHPLKTKKCQPAAGDRPDLIQTAPVPSSWLARQKQKNQPNEKMTKKLKNEKWSLFRLKNGLTTSWKNIHLKQKSVSLLLGTGQI